MESDFGSPNKFELTFQYVLLFCCHLANNQNKTVTILQNLESFLNGY